MKTCAFVLFALGLGLTSPAFADARDTTEALAAAEHAYQEVDFAATREQATRALESGGATPEQTARLHVLLGISAAALADADDAKAHFIAALAVDPHFRLDKNLSPKIRDPYLEAQGYWSAAAERLSLRAAPTANPRQLLIRLQDPASLVQQLEIRVAAVRSPRRTLQRLESSAQQLFSVPASVGEGDYEYILRALDRYGNVLSEHGSDLLPELVHARARDQSPTASERAPGRSYLLPVVLGVTGIGAVVTGVLFNVRREQAAHEWNGPRCEHPGFTRQQQCETVSSRIHLDQGLALGFYAGGGALLAGSAISVLFGRPPSSERASALGCTVAGVGVSCLGTF